MQNRKKVGRPSKYCEAVVDEIIDRLVENEPLTHICRSRRMPSISTVMSWLRIYPEFRSQYEFAHEIRYETIVDDLVKRTSEKMTRNERSAINKVLWREAHRLKKYGRPE